MFLRRFLRKQKQHLPPKKTLTEEYANANRPPRTRRALQQIRATNKLFDIDDKENAQLPQYHIKQNKEARKREAMRRSGFLTYDATVSVPVQARPDLIESENKFEDVGYTPLCEEKHSSI